jgi:hypothetical protein
VWGHWLFGDHILQFTIKLKCGITVVVRVHVFNHDPPK